MGGGWRARTRLCEYRQMFVCASPNACVHVSCVCGMLSNITFVCAGVHTTYMDNKCMYMPRCTRLLYVFVVFQDIISVHVLTC